MNALSSREKQVVTGGAILVLVFILIQFVYLPGHDRHRALEKSLVSEQQSLERIRHLEAQYQAMTRSSQELDSLVRTRDKTFTLFSFLDRQAEKAGVKAHIDYMKTQHPVPGKQPLFPWGGQAEIKTDRVQGFSAIYQPCGRSFKRY